MPVGVQCPISSSLDEFPSYWDWLGFRPYRCPSPSPSLSILGVFHSLLSAIGFQSCFFFTADASPPIRSTLYFNPSLTHFLGEFPGLGLALVPDVVVPEAEQRCAWSRKLDPNFCPGQGRTSDLGIYRPRILPLDSRAPLLLVASYDMQEATARQF